MAKKILFSKLVAAGNDFIVIDDRSGKVSKTASKLAQKLCDRKFGIGADGLLLLGKSKKADISMTIINSDGSHADMCGNGVRCLSYFALLHGIVDPKHSVETGAGIVHVSIKKNIAKAKLTQPKDYKAEFEIDVNGQAQPVYFLNTGVPHTVVYESKLNEVDVNSKGRFIRYHKAFAPKGTNVNFVQKNAQGIQVRTYERGVEAETLACGTGSTASALISAKVMGLKSPVSVTTKSGEILKVYFEMFDHTFDNVYLEGPVTKTFEGSIEI